ncbi:hypothetical protein PCHCB_000510900, partial [Plasmodium chabaudi chabaudi]
QNNEKDKNKLKVSLLKDLPPAVLNKIWLPNKKFEPLHNDYTPIESNTDDLLKKQNNIKVENTLYQVHKPLNKGITKENVIQDYKHFINTDTKQNEIKEINKIRDSYDQTNNNSSNKKEIIIEIFIKDKEKRIKDKK